MSCSWDLAWDRQTNTHTHKHSTSINIQDDSLTQLSTRTTLSQKKTMLGHILVESLPDQFWQTCHVSIVLRHSWLTCSNGIYYRKFLNTCIAFCHCLTITLLCIHAFFQLLESVEVENSTLFIEDLVLQVWMIHIMLVNSSCSLVHSCISLNIAHCVHACMVIYSNVEKWW